MVLDERSRHELHLKLEEVLGPEQAATLMEMLPPVGWADVATKRDLDQIEQRMDLRFEVVYTKFDAVLDRIDAAEQRLRAEFSNQTRNMAIGMIGTVLATVFGVAALT
jgi:hypothetical protein